MFLSDQVFNGITRAQWAETDGSSSTWFTFGVGVFALSLALVLSTEKVTDRIYTYDKNIFTSNESFFAAIVIMSIISIVGIGVGKLVWI
ncbi:MAG: hypothetical protein ABIG63_02400, partial [Chloroflexota bacterium]